MTNMDYPPILKVSQACEMMQVSREKMYQWIYSGKVPYLKEGRIIRLSRDKLLELVAQGKLN